MQSTGNVKHIQFRLNMQIPNVNWKSEVITHLIKGFFYLRDSIRLDHLQTYISTALKNAFIYFFNYLHEANVSKQWRRAAKKVVHTSTFTTKQLNNIEQDSATAKYVQVKSPGRLICNALIYSWPCNHQNGCQKSLSDDFPKLRNTRL